MLTYDDVYSKPIGASSINLWNNIITYKSMSRPFGHLNNITILSGCVKSIFNVIFLIAIFS